MLAASNEEEIHTAPILYIKTVSYNPDRTDSNSQSATSVERREHLAARFVHHPQLAAADRLDSDSASR